MVLTKCVENLHKHMLDSAREVSKPNYSGPKRFKRANTWWSDDLEVLHREKKEIWRQYKSTGFKSQLLKAQLKKAKTTFRNLQKKNQKNVEYVKLKKLSTNFETNKPYFWRLMRDAQRDQVETEVSIEKLREHTEKLFNEKLINSTINEQQSQEPTNHTDSIRLGQGSIRWILKNLSNGKAVGHANVPSEMFKYGCSIELVSYLHLLFTTMINENQMPDNFNVGVIKPLVKDKNKDLNDTNNLRPITISDAISNIYEKVLLHEIEKYIPGSNKQFGFKKHSSCAHAVFCLRETALQCMQEKKKYLSAH